MNTAQFNAMLHAARELLRLYHAGTETDPHVVRWAQTLVAENPRDKRRPQPIADVFLALFDDPETRVAGLTTRAAETGTKFSTKTVRKAFYRLTHDGQLWLLPRAPGERAGRYFAAAADRDAAQKAKPARQDVAPAAERQVAAGVVAKSAAVPKTAQKPKKEPKMKIPRLAKTPPPRQSQAFNGAGQEPHAPMAAKVPRNPDVKKPAKGKITREEWQSLPAENPNNVQPQIGPGLGYDSRYQLPPDARVPGAGFAAVGIGRSLMGGKAW
jgi:uncharacterized protein YceH (UPF0502 family)